MTEQQAVDAAGRELEKHFLGNQVDYDGQGEHTWTVSGATEEENGIDRLDTAVGEVNRLLKGWSLYRPDHKGNVYHLDENDKVGQPGQ
jgi:hypothetical protein